MKPYTIEKILEKIVYFIIFIKIIFLISAIGSIFFEHYNKTSAKSKLLDLKFSYWKERMEFIFTICMALLLIFIFNPWHKNQIYITKEMGLLFYLFGFILIITAKWGVFIKESSWYKRISSSLK